MELLTGLFEQNVAPDQHLKAVVDNMMKTILHRLIKVTSSETHVNDISTVNAMLATAEKLLQLRLENQDQRMEDFDVIDEVDMACWPTPGGNSMRDEEPVPTASNQQGLEEPLPPRQNFIVADWRTFAHDLMSLGSEFFGNTTSSILRKPKAVDKSFGQDIQPEMKALLAAFYGRQFNTSRSLEQMKAECSQSNRDWGYLRITSDNETAAIGVFKFLSYEDQKTILDMVFCDAYVPSTIEADAMHGLLNKLWEEQGEALKIPKGVGRNCQCGFCYGNALQAAKANIRPLFWTAWKEALFEHNNPPSETITVNVTAPHLEGLHRPESKPSLSMTFKGANATSSLEEKCANPTFVWTEQEWHFTNWRGINTTTLMKAEIRALLRSVVCRTAAPIEDFSTLAAIYNDAMKYWEKYIYTEPKSSGWCGTMRMSAVHREEVRQEAFLIRAFAEWPRSVEEIAKEVEEIIAPQRPLNPFYDYNA